MNIINIRKEKNERVYSFSGVPDEVRMCRPVVRELYALIMDYDDESISVG